MSHSEHRQRTRFRGLRLFEDEDEYLAAAAKQLNTTVPELIRAVMFNRPVHQSRPCSANHPTCSAHHLELVNGYRELQRREQLNVEETTGMHRGDLQHWRDKGGKFTTFADWLRAHQISPREQEERNGREAG